MLQNWRIALRSIAKRPAMAFAIVLTLTLSIGANSAIFSAIDTVLLKPLPFRDPERLVAVFETQSQRNRQGPVALVRLNEWAAQTTAFEGFAGSYTENVTDTTGSQPERLAAVRTSGRFFSLLGVSAAIGRTPAEGEHGAGSPNVVVLSDGVWRQRFNADPSIVGRSLILAGGPRTVIGVMPASFRYPTATVEAWVPEQLPANFPRDSRFFISFARLKSDRTLEQAQQDLAAVQARLGQQFPKTDKDWSTAIVPLKEEQVGGVRRSLWLLFGAVVLVLVTACGNIALLMLADAARREHDVVMQCALGASRRTIVSQRLREGAIVAFTGAVGGLVVADWGIDGLRAMAAGLPRSADLGVDVRLAAFTLTVGVLTTLVFALVPAILATRPKSVSRAGHGLRGQVTGHKRVQTAVMIAQIALAIVLLVGSGLLIRSFSRLQHVSLGFDPNNVLTFRISASWSERPSAVTVRQSRTLQRLVQVPGVVAAAVSNIIPATADAEYAAAQFQIVGRPADANNLTISRSVSADYFRTVGIPVEQGSTCRDDPGAEASGEVVVNRAFADTYFPGEHPIGRSFVRQTPNVIVGVVANARERSLTEEAQPVRYVCGLMPFYPDPYYLVRVDPSRPASMMAIRAAVNEIEPERAIYTAMTLRAALSEVSSESTMTTLLLSLFAGMALLLVAVGLYGILAQFVAERRREIGVRIALGARPAQVLSQVVRRSAAVTIAGIVLGLMIALSSAHVMSALVFGVSAHDPLTFILAPLILAAISAVATILPARRAARVDPLVALRYE
jgi:predicted permease